MEEFFGAILTALAEIIFEFLLDAVFAVLVGILSRVFRLFSLTIRKADPVTATIIFGIVGACFGFLSLWLFPHRLVHPTRFPGISLLISPILTGLLMGQIGRTVQRRARQSARIETFTFGFVFAFAMSFVRLWLVR